MKAVILALALALAAPALAWSPAPARFARKAVVSCFFQRYGTPWPVTLPPAPTTIMKCTANAVPSHRRSPRAWPNASALSTTAADHSHQASGRCGRESQCRGQARRRAGTWATTPQRASRCHRGRRQRGAPLRQPRHHDRRHCRRAALRPTWSLRSLKTQPTTHYPPRTTHTYDGWP